MYKLNKKKGFSLVEVMCSITLFSILFMITLTIELKVLKLEKYNKEINNYSIVVEEIKNTMIYNFTYDDLKKISLEHKYYMPIENIGFDKIETKGVTNMFVETKPLKDPYIKISIDDGKVLKVNFKLYTEAINNKIVMECEFYKGKYKR